MILRKFLYLILFLLTIQACDYVDGPYKETATTPTENTEAVQKVLLEDYTGHKCGNCPRAAEKIEELKQIYGDKIIPVAVHVGFFAVPATSGTAYTTDFRTETGNVWDNFFGNSVVGLPNGMINRREFQNSRVFSVDQWASEIQTVLQQDPMLEINISAQETANKLDADVTVRFLYSYTGQLYLNVILLENNVKDWQKDYEASPSDISDYTHNHILRMALTPDWGEAFQNLNYATDETLDFNFENVEILNTNNVENVDIVAFVTDETKQVIQAELIELK